MHPEFVENRGWEMISVREMLETFQKKDPLLTEEAFRCAFRRIWGSFVESKTKRARPSLELFWSYFGVILSYFDRIVFFRLQEVEVVQNACPPLRGRGIRILHLLIR